MSENAVSFLAWCKEHGNSPDVINLRWFLENRTTFGYPGHAECDKIMAEVKALKDLL